MHKSHKLLYAVLFSVGIVLASPTFASYFSSYEFFIGEWAPGYWEYFGGCEDNDNNPGTALNCINDDEGDTFFNIGDYNVKQGVYSVHGPAGHDHGKFILQYQYRFISAEDKDNTTDIGYVKLKDVDTNHVYYLKTLTAANETEDWKKMRIVLDPKLSQKKLQLVLEVVNDDQRLSTMGINNIQLTHGSQPTIHGTVYETISGKQFVAANVVVQLKDSTGETTLKETQTDENGQYTFFPVKAKRGYTVVTGSDQQSIEKVYGGSEYTVDLYPQE